MNVSRKILFIFLLCISNANLFAMKAPEESPKENFKREGTVLVFFGLNPDDAAGFKRDVPPIDFSRIIDVDRFGIAGVESLFMQWLYRLYAIMALCVQSRTRELRPLAGHYELVPFYFEEQRKFLQGRKGVKEYEENLERIVELEDIVVLKIDELLTYMRELINKWKAKAKPEERKRLTKMEEEIARRKKELAEQLQAAQARQGTVQEMKEEKEKEE